jgi:hypothetical protein
MADMKTVPTTASVAAFIDAIPDAGVRKDCKAIAATMKRATGEKARMWGPSIVGFGKVHYEYASGREGDMPIVAFSPRKRNLTLYISHGFKRYPELMKKLGKHQTSVACIYFKSLADLDRATFEELVTEAVKHTRAKYR